MKRLLILTTLMAAAITVRAESTFVIPSQDHSIESLVRSESSRTPEERTFDDQHRAVRNWKISIAPVLASQLLDTASSYGMRELNPLLASGDGRFGAKAAGIKFGATAAILGVEYLIVKRHPGAAKVFAKLNWSGAALTSAAAVRNYSIR